LKYPCSKAAIAEGTNRMGVCKNTKMQETRISFRNVENFGKKVWLKFEVHVLLQPVIRNALPRSCSLIVPKKTNI